MNYNLAIDNGTRVDAPASTSDAEITTLRCAEELRAIGQALEAQTFISIELEVEGDGYWVRAETDQSTKADLSFGAIVKQFFPSFGSLPQTKKQAAGRAVEVRYSAEEIQKLTQKGVARRLVGKTVPDHFSLSNILRQSGAYVDSLHHATLVRVAVKGHWITICYMTDSGQLREFKQDRQFFYDHWVKMYLHRSNRLAPMLSGRYPTYVTSL